MEQNEKEREIGDSFLPLLSFLLSFSCSRLQFRFGKERGVEKLRHNGGRHDVKIAQRKLVFG